MNDLNRTPERDAILQEKRDDAYFRDLARISSTLLAALIALMTFLLIVGVQTKVTGFTTELYTAVVLLGVSLVLFALRNIARGFNSTMVAMGIRILQQLVFVASVVAVVWFVISYAQLVVKPPATQQGASQSQGQSPEAPSAQQGAQQPQGGGPAPGETAEQHAAETAKQGAQPPAQPGQ